MIPPRISLAAAFLLLAQAGSSAAEDFSEDGFTRDDLRDWEKRAGDEDKKKVSQLEEEVKKREEAQRQQQHLPAAQRTGPEAPEDDGPSQPVARVREGRASLADLEEAAEQEKVKAAPDAVNNYAVHMAPGALAITEAYFLHVYCNGNSGNGDSARYIAIVRAALEKPGGWSIFPTVEMGWLPEPVLGIWSGGKVVLKIPSMAVISHEIGGHHFDGALSPPMDGEGRLRPPPTTESVRKAAEEFAYYIMTKELGGGRYVHCQPRPLRSPLKS